jgi:hypothetical protein
MGYRAHVQTKHVIEYGGCHFNSHSNEIKDWLVENLVDVCGDSDNDYDRGPEWELDKCQLRNIPELAYHSIGEGVDEITADELRDFVRELIDAPTGDYAYVSWF